MLGLKLGDNDGLNDRLRLGDNEGETLELGDGDMLDEILGLIDGLVETPLVVVTSTVLP